MGYCLNCGKLVPEDNRIFCDACASRLPLAYPPYPSSRACIPYVSTLWYLGAGRALILRDKYYSENVHYSVWARLLYRRVREADWGTDFDFVVPVPGLFSDSRGGVFSTHVSEYLSGLLHCRVFRGVRKKPYTYRAKDCLSGNERVKRMRGAFSSSTIHGRVLIVDDVLMTGGTVAGVSMALRRAGAERVFAAVLACGNYREEKERGLV